MTDLPTIFPEHHHTGISVLEHLDHLDLTPVEMDEQIRHAWEHAAPGTSADAMAHYFQAFALFLALTSEDIARRFLATLKDHGLSTGVPVLIADLYSLGNILPHNTDPEMPDHTGLVLRYLRILRRLQTTQTPSRHQWIQFTGQVSLEAGVHIANDPDAWGETFRKTLQSSNIR